MTDEELMGIALEEAWMAFYENEVPVGAVLYYRDQILARNHNRMVQRKNPLAHAELLVLMEGIQRHPDPWLLDSVLYVTLEPCVMCAGAIVLMRIPRLVFAAGDPKAGACGSTLDIPGAGHLNHHPNVDRGLYGEEASRLLKDFFQRLRSVGSR